MSDSIQCKISLIGRLCKFHVFLNKSCIFDEIRFLGVNLQETRQPDFTKRVSCGGIIP